MRLPLQLAAVSLLAFATLAQAHDSWISRQGLRNPAGEWCCGENDCFVTPAQIVSLPAPGYRLPDGEFVPQAEAMPSPDGQFWRCKRHDGTRRCFFAPPPAM